MSHTYHSINYHIVFSTKYRRPTIDAALKPRLYAYMAGIINNGYGFTRIINGVEDHIHILCRMAKILTIADLIKELKRESSKWVKQQDLDLRGFSLASGLRRVLSQSVPRRRVD